MAHRLAVVYIGDPLLMFLTSEPERFGVVNPEYVIQQLRANNYPEVKYLINELPLLNRGYALRTSISTLIQIYIRINLHVNLGIIDTDDYMNLIFGGEIPASYYRHQGDDRFKIPMKEAVDQGLVDHPLNTYESLDILDNDTLPYYTIQRIIAVNTLSINGLDAETRAYLNDPAIQQQLERESEIIINARDKFGRMAPAPNQLEIYRNYIASEPIKLPEE